MKLPIDTQRCAISRKPASSTIAKGRISTEPLDLSFLWNENQVIEQFLDDHMQLSNFEKTTKCEMKMK